jgi:hypothetical protein
MTTPQHPTLASVFAALRAYRITHDDKTVVNIYAPADHGPPMIRVLIDDGCIERGCPYDANRDDELCEGCTCGRAEEDEDE